MYLATVRVPGSCGELVQGSLEGTNFLITCPINLYSSVTVKLSKDIDGYRASIRAEKTIRAVKKTLCELGRNELGARVEIKSQLLRGRGMASSTADITAAVGATMAALGYNPDYDLIKRVALEIEPTDGVFLPGIYLFDHLRGEVIEGLGKPPLLHILIFSEKGRVDTIAFNQRSDLKKLNSHKESMIQEAASLVKAGIRVKDPGLIGRGATLSSLAHQSILFKPNLEKIINLTEGMDEIYGVNVAHSGTLIGLLIDINFPEGELLAEIETKIPELTFIKRVQLVSGGLEVISKDLISYKYST